jgi:hypothetical protein
MPVAKGPALSTRNTLLLGLGAVALAIGLLLLVLWVAGEGGEVEVRIGDDTFDAGDADRISAEIADRGPILYSDVGGGTRDIILQHLGDDPEEGWYAFDARQPGAPRDCFLQWRPGSRDFVALCDPTVVVDERGTGQPQYEVRIENGDVIVDISPDDDAETTTTTTTAAAG